MARAELMRCMTPLAMALAAAFPWNVMAQSTPPVPSPTDVRYTPTTAGEAALYPQVPGADAKPPTLFLGDPKYAANSAVARLVVEVDRDVVPADGQTPVALTVRVFGRDGQPLKTPVLVTLEHSGGRVLLPGARTDEFGPGRRDADRVTPGVQVEVTDGVAELRLLAPAEAQDVRVRISAGSEEAAGVIAFVPEMRPMVAAGLIDGIVNFNRRGGGVVQTVRSNDGFDQEIDAWSRQFNGGKANVAGRAAFYLKGVVRGDLLLTAAYDSDKDTRARLLRDIRPDELYPVYGDASLRSYDARTGDRLYVRVDKDKSYVMYGDFVTGDGFSQPIGQGNVASMKQRSLGAYNRTATGARWHHEESRGTANVFAFNDSLRQVVQEYASQGSGPYALRNGAVLEGSDKIEVLVRDRQQPSRIVSVRALQRLVDYSFEPFSGRILLAAPLAAFDENLNPVSLRVSYEVDQGGDKFWVGGADGQWRIGDNVEVGGSVVTDRNPLAPYDLGSANATVRFGPHSALVAEVARSRSNVNTNPANQASTPSLANRSGDVEGDAWRVELAHEDERTEARAFIGRSSPEFNNSAAPLNGGRGEANVKGSVKIVETLKAYGEVLASEDRNPGGGKRSAIGGGLQWKATERLTVDVGLRSSRETVGTQGNGISSVPFGDTSGLSGSIATGSAGGAVGYGNQSIDPTTGLPMIVQGGTAPAVSDLPAGTRLESEGVHVGLGFRVTDQFTVGGEVEQSVSGDERRRWSAGGDYQFTERTKLYGRYEHQQGWVQLAGATSTNRSANAFVFGVDTSYVKDTQVFSEYRLRDAIAGRDLQMASGVRNNWDVAAGVRIATGYERLSVVSGKTAPSDAVNAGIEYSADPLWRASTRVEHRRSGDLKDTADNERFHTTLWQAMLARKLDRDWTLLTRNYLLATRYAAHGGVTQDRAQLGVAYRDTDTNRINALGKVEYKLEKDASNATTGELSSRAWIVSTHADYHPSRPWWVTGRVAAKWQRDRFENGVPGAFRAQLISARLVYDVTKNWDVGVLGAAQFGQYGARQTAYGAEVGYLLQTNLWVSVGINAAGFRSDADLSGNEYTRRGVYVRLRFKFDENLFRGNDPAVNRSLDR